MAERICATPGCGATLWRGNGLGVCRPCMARARMTRFNADPEFVAKKLVALRRPEVRERIAAGRRAYGLNGARDRTPSRGVVDHLTPEEARDYRTLMRHDYRRDEALAAIGRGDLIERRHG